MSVPAHCRRAALDDLWRALLTQTTLQFREDQKYLDWKWNLKMLHVCTYICDFVHIRSCELKDTKIDLIFSCSRMVTCHPCCHKPFKPYSEASHIRIEQRKRPRACPFAHRWNPPKFFIMQGKKNEAYLIKLIAIITLCISKMPSSSGTQGLIINVSLILFLSIKDPVEQKKSLLTKANVIFNTSS